MLISNNTHYYSEYTKRFNLLPDNNSFAFESSKRTGYMQRLYYEYEYTKIVGGQAFYYTFTYNNRAIPYQFGMPVFSYHDIRLITNGMISKRLLRNYGSKLRYFLTCESGEGKGKRGLGNNPHYHVIFFIQPANEFYKPISPLDFRDLCRELWQGTTKWIDWRFARFGHVQEGCNLGVVLSSDCFSYVVKYVLKDDLQKDVEFKVEQIFYNQLKERHFDNTCLLQYYYFLRSECFCSHNEFCYRTGIRIYWKLRKLNKSLTYSDFLDNYSDYYSLSPYYIHQFKTWFIDNYIHERVAFMMSQFKNEYSGKVRCSKDLGIYGLKFLNPNCPSFVIPSGGQYKVQYPCLFYIRKLYFDVVKCPVTGNPLYVLNDMGIRQKVEKLPTSIKLFANRVRDNISIFLKNNLVIPDNLHSFDVDWSTGVINLPDTFDNSQTMFIRLNNFGFDYILYIYSIFHNVYQYRCYTPSFSTLLNDDFNLEDVVEDYKLFLKHSFYYLDYEHVQLNQAHIRNCVSFDSHPLFSPFLDYFKFLDSLNDVVDKYLSSVRKQQFKEQGEHQKAMKSAHYNSLSIL